MCGAVRNRLMNLLRPFYRLRLGFSLKRFLEQIIWPLIKGAINTGFGVKVQDGHQITGVLHFCGVVVRCHHSTTLNQQGFERKHSHRQSLNRCR